MSEQKENVGLEEVPGEFDSVIDDKNYATDQKVLVRVKEDILPLLRQVRDDRVTLQNRWDRFRKVWAGVHYRKLYEGRANLYWRLVYKAVETFVAHIRTNVFPHVDAFDIEPSPFDPISMINAPIARRLVKHDIEQAKVEQKLDTALRNGLIDGSSIIKSVWHTHTSTNYRRKLSPVRTRGQQGYTFGRDSVVLYEGPTFQPINLLDFYIYPMTVDNVHEAQLVFEEVYHTRNYLISMKNSGKFANVDDVLAKDPKETLAKDDYGDASKDDRLERDGITQDEARRNLKNVYRLQEIWCQFDLYGTGKIIPCKILTCNDETVLEVRQNPFFEQKAPYFQWQVIQVQNNVYGQGVVEPAEHLNEAANAVGNQLLDSNAFQTNHIIGVNVALLAQDVSSLRIAPRAIWPALANPDEVFRPFRPPDNTQSSLISLQLLSGSIQDVMGAPPTLQGKFSNADKTATEIAATQSGAQAAVNGMIRNFEAQVLSPLISWWWKLEQQFRAVETETKITGTQAMHLAPTDVVGDYTFRWRTSSQVPVDIAQMNAMKEMQEGGMAGAPMGEAGAPQAGGAPGMGLAAGNLPGPVSAAQLGTVPQFGL